ncbi:hypothetical protein FQA47_000226 [Oryzias melastigma]|uniref:Uncharacterized protein n=1 Tax=Oryzias melastigma TaxID=30732 RepID=A0A834CB13_ORYME|nr:hypothetical protein FQA47_000226 [Oryzias melastigma]
MNLESSSSQETFAEDTESSGSIVILERSTPESRGSPEANDVDEEPETPDSRQNQARHYKVLQELYKSRPTLNKKDVAQLLDLEYQARRAYIDSDVMKEQDRPTKILQAYPCFRDLDHIMDELHRILNLGNPHFISELKNRWRIFFEKAQFYGVFKKVLKPPMGDKVNQTIALMKALPEMFPSPVTPPKKLGHSSEVMLHILEPAEYPNTFLHSRPLFSPVVIVCDTNCILAIGTMPVLIFPKEDIFDSVMYVMACYYTFHLTYPKCIAKLLSVLQTEVLMDAIHARDMTSSYKKAMAEWKKFTE